eukprot:Em0098g9a
MKHLFEALGLLWGITNGGESMDYKAVLVMACELKQGPPGQNKDVVLMRPLRDMNFPKFVFEVFLGLIGDFFPGLDCPRVHYPKFNDAMEGVPSDGKHIQLPHRDGVCGSKEVGIQLCYVLKALLAIHIGQMTPLWSLTLWWLSTGFSGSSCGGMIDTYVKQQAQLPGLLDLGRSPPTTSTVQYSFAAQVGAVLLPTMNVSPAIPPWMCRGAWKPVWKRHNSLQWISRRVRGQWLVQGHDWGFKKFIRRGQCDDKLTLYCKEDSHFSDIMLIELEVMRSKHMKQHRQDEGDGDGKDDDYDNGEDDDGDGEDDDHHGGDDGDGNMEWVSRWPPYPCDHHTQGCGAEDGMQDLVLEPDGAYTNPYVVDTELGKEITAGWIINDHINIMKAKIDLKAAFHLIPHSSFACPPDKLEQLTGLTRSWLSKHKAIKRELLSLIEPDKTEADSLQLFTDASGSLGFGTYFNGGWFRGDWQPHQCLPLCTIQWLELFAIMAVASTRVPSGLGYASTSIVTTSPFPGLVKTVCKTA